MGAAILWVGQEATCVYWISAQCLAGASEEESDESLLSLTHLLEQERPDLRERVVGVLSLEANKLDDAMLFAIARDYLLPHARAAHHTSSGQP